jgi:protein-tyrosine-phosphatase
MDTRTFCAGALAVVGLLGCEMRREAEPSLNDLKPKLKAFAAGIPASFNSIPNERKEALRELASFVTAKQKNKEPAQLTFVCTHNSRRSHLGQIWATVAAHAYGVSGVTTFSGGTEATAFNPRAVAALERAGFELQNPGGSNPRYRVSFSAGVPALEAFSKKYDDPSNPRSGFAAVMTCSEADKKCPVVHGAALRVALPYEDPKSSDGTAAEAASYDERSRQIATEMFYLFSEVRG